MQIGMIGLGRMGMNMVKRLLEGGHSIVVYDINEAARKDAEKLGAKSVDSLAGFQTALSKSRVVWVMVPAGDVTEKTIVDLAGHLEPGDVIIDGGNSYFKDSMQRADELAKKGIRFLDAGTSGGVWGLTVGYCLMVGGDAATFALAEPAFKTLAPEKGYALVGPSGAGHFVKMTHNGIEYAMMQAYAEGFEIMKERKGFDLDLPKIAALWNQGSVVRSWLLELAADALEKDPKLDSIKGYVEDSGEGRWTVFSAIEEDVPAPVITASLYERFRSRQEESFGNKMLAALRNEFGGHRVLKK